MSLSVTQAPEQTKDQVGKTKRKREDSDAKIHKKPKNDTDKLVFFSKSAKAKPGKGAHESISSSPPVSYSRLPKDFRSRLSNFYQGPNPFPFQLPGFSVPHTFASIEHAFHACKYALSLRSRPYALQLAATAPRPIVTSAEARSFGRKGCRLTSEELEVWDGSQFTFLAEMTRSAYLADPERTKVLLDTGHAELWHLVTARGKKSTLQHWTFLEELRDELSQ